MAELMTDSDLKSRRAAARRTAVWLGVVAAAIFAAFLLSGVLGR
jgi:hypothetical protein